MSARKGGCIILLDVPPSSSITIDGITRVTPNVKSQPQGFNGGLFIVNKIISSSEQDTPLHLLVVRAGKETSNHHPGGSLPVGFVLLPDSTDDWVCARRYDPQTEEISNEPLDEVTTRNLMNAITEEGGVLRKYAMSYNQFMGDEKNITSWKERTSLVDGLFLCHQHGLGHGDKIVPSSYNTSCDDDDGNASLPNSETKKPINTVIDGTSVSYPNIPCIDPTISARLLTRHAGTKAYISNLDPSVRTWLLSGGACNLLTNTQINTGSCEEYIWNDILRTHYNGAGCEKRDDFFLADIQLAFVLFLFLECQSSLEHWRDAVSMSSLSINSERSLMHKSTFILQLLPTLYAQLSCIEADFFHETEYSSGESNFLIGALKRLCDACDTLSEATEINNRIKGMSMKLQKLASNRFHVNISSSSAPDLTDCDIDMTTDAYATECGGDNTVQLGPIDDDDEIEDEDGPVIVPSSEVEASISRSSMECLQAKKYQTLVLNQDYEQYRADYPLLFAAIAPQEDVVMTCARVLDAGNDVSLVREAAAYLEQVEACRR
eukprot:scaffold3416_cov76-Cyclotella_meneghiniana.AAC.2